MRYTIVIDDDDRDQATDKPWVAWIEGDSSDESGIGETPLHALADLLGDLVATHWPQGEP